MGYRGGDLDLRMSQPRGGERGSFEPPLNGGRDVDSSYGSEPIFVDETLLACCNHAYDVALAHRSADVRLEHLIFALTRVDQAAEVLEKHGVRDASLRRDAGAYIASELPLAPTNGQSTPRRAPAMEQALKLAAQYAYKRNRPASVSDLLHVLTEVKSDLPGLQLLHRHMPNFSNDLASEPPPVYRAAPEFAYYAGPAMEPVRQPMRPAYFDEYAMPAQPMAYRPVQSHTDSVQNSRLATLEKLVLSLREDNERMSEELSGRFVSLESSFAGSRGGSIDMSPLEKRIDRLEALLREERADVAKISEAVVEKIAEKVADEIDDRLRALEATVREKGGGDVDLMPLEGRLNDIETAVLSFTENPQSVNLEGITQRLAAVEQGIANRLDGAEQQRIADRERSMQHSTAVANDVRGLQQALTAQSGSMQRVEATLKERIEVMSRLVQDMQSGRTEVAQRLESLETVLIRNGQEATEGRETSVRELGEVHEAIVKLNANQHTLAGAIDQWRSESVNDMNTISVRLAQLDQENDAPMRRLDLISERMDGMYRATVERYHRRNRFWYWLFGTDDWIGSSWPSQTKKVEEELRVLRGEAAMPPPA